MSSASTKAGKHPFPSEAYKLLQRDFEAISVKNTELTSRLEVLGQLLDDTSKQNELSKAVAG